ncbi:MAG: nucleotidyltransferase domain-containing protein [Thermoanaerobaculia bacterium]
MDEPFIARLEQSCDTKWHAIDRAAERTQTELRRIGTALAKFDDPSTSIIATGSYGRGEVTGKSDLDWILLIDGPSDPNHLKLARGIESELAKMEIKSPGPTGTFGSLVDSHELVHHIGGTSDTNENLTRRVLLLTESVALTHPEIRERVIRNVLSRYVVHDRPIASRSDRKPSRIPHFLLNDVVRYWRTIASDFASKMWERAGEGWAIRNVKLRFSRKLIFVAGLLTCFSAEILRPVPLEGASDDEAFFVLLADFIREQSNLQPLEKLARTILPYPETALKILGPYDFFLSILDDESEREVLEKVTFEQAPSNEIYNRLRDRSQEFRDGIERLFFDDDPDLRRLIRKVGVF